jgi:predicted lactoylglutathione lyase
MKQIFINLPVKDIEASMNFYKQLGFTFKPLFSFDDQKCMVWSDQIYVML